MTYITDPELLAQLNAPEQANEGYINDPELLAKIEGDKKQNWLQRQQNTWYGGAGTSLANHALDALSAPEQFARGLGNMPTTLANMLPGVNLPYMNQGQQLGGYQIPEPEEPTKGYKIGHALGTGASYAPLVASGAGMAVRAVPTLGKLAARTLKANPAEIAAQIESRVSPAAMRQVKGPASARYQDLEKASEGSPFYSDQELANSYMQRNYGKQPDYSKYINFPESELTAAHKGYGETGVNTIHDLFMANPDYKKAQTLQSDLGKKINYYQKKSRGPAGLAPGENEILMSTKKLKDVLKDEIKDYWGKKGGNHLNEYNEADRIWAQEVKPLENLAKKVEVSRYQPGNKLDPRKLYNNLETASTDLALKNKPMPKDILELKDILKQRLDKKDLYKHLAISGVHKTLAGAGIGLGGYGSYALLKHLLPNR